MELHSQLLGISPRDDMATQVMLATAGSGAWRVILYKWWMVNDDVFFKLKINHL